MNIQRIMSGSLLHIGTTTPSYDPESGFTESHNGSRGFLLTPRIITKVLPTEYELLIMHILDDFLSADASLTRHTRDGLFSYQASVVLVAGPEVLDHDNMDFSTTIIDKSRCERHCYWYPFPGDTGEL